MSVMGKNISFIDQSNAEVAKIISLKASHLLSMKEKQRIVLGEFLNSEILNFNASGAGVTRFPLTYRLELLGQLQGKVLLNLEPSLARRVAVILFGDESALLPEDIDNAMQELLNIFSGHLATAFNQLGVDFDIATPELTDEDFLGNHEGKRVLFRYRAEDQVLQFVLIMNQAVVHAG